MKRFLWSLPGKPLATSEVHRGKIVFRLVGAAPSWEYDLIDGVLDIAANTTVMIERDWPIAMKGAPHEARRGQQAAPVLLPEDVIPCGLDGGYQFRVQRLVISPRTALAVHGVSHAVQVVLLKEVQGQPGDHQTLASIALHAPFRPEDPDVAPTLVIDDPNGLIITAAG